MNESDIDLLLRKQSPEVPVPPGLETRIRASLRLSRSRKSRLPWLAIPAAALVALVLAVAPDHPRATTATPADAPAAEALPDLALTTGGDLSINPLGDEARALRQDAERTGRFLLDCLPSLSVAER